MSIPKPIQSILAKVKLIETELGARFIERSEEIHGAVVAIIAEQHVLYIGPPGTAKCYGEGTPILMYNGKIKLVEDIQPKDWVMGDDSTPRKVLNLVRGKGKLYKITPIKGDSFIVNEDHILPLVKSGRRIRSHGVTKGYRNEEEFFDVSVKDFLQIKGRERYKLYRTGVEFAPKQVLIDPYILGLWLGDGNKGNAGITSFDPEIIEKIEIYAKELQLQVTSSRKGKYSITRGHQIGGSQAFSFQGLLRNYNLIKNKHIPDVYKHNSWEMRLALLAGLIDSDGTKDSRYDGLSYTCTDKRLMEDVIYLCRSLGFAAYRKWSHTTCGDLESTSYRIYISGDLSQIPIQVERKKCGERKQIKNPLIVGFKIELVGIDDYYGFSLNGNQRHLLGDFTVQHNSALAQGICSSMKKINYFEYLLGKDCVKDEIFGPPSLPGLKKEQFYRVLTNMMSEAHIVCLEEIWKGNTTLLNGFLSIVNERVFYNGTSGVVSSPLISLFGTSNELPDDVQLNALYDRFMLRYIVEYVGEDSAFKSMLKTQTNRAMPKLLTLDDISALHEFRMTSVEVGDDIYNSIALVRGNLRKEGVLISDRRWKTCLDLLKAEAMVRGSNEVEKIDLDILSNALWNMPQDKKKVSTAITSISNPSLVRAVELKDAIADAYNKAMNASDDQKDGLGIEANKKMTKAMKELKELSSRTPSRKLTEIMKLIERQKDDVLHHCLGVETVAGSDDDILDLQPMSRSELKRLIKERKLEVVVLQKDTDDQLRTKVYDAMTAAAGEHVEIDEV